MKLNPKKAKFMLVSRSRIIAPGYDDLILGDAELEEIKGFEYSWSNLSLKAFAGSCGKGSQESGSRAPRVKVV